MEILDMNIIKQPNKENSILLVWAGAIYMLTIVIVIISSWLSKLYLFNLSLTVSLYVGVRQWTSVIYFIGATIIGVLVFSYVLKTKMNTIKSIVYFMIITSIVGCAWFPCNSSRSVLTTTVHNYFSYALIILVTISLVLMTIFARNKKQKVFAICGILYSTFFIVAFAFGFHAFQSTVLVWENIFIFVLLFELYLEKYDLV